MDNSIRSNGNGGRGLLCAWLCVGLLLMAPATSWSGESDVADTAAEGGLGGASALATLVYGPLKLVYAMGGATIAGCAWAFSGGDSEVADTVLTRAVRGTYVITPDELRGRKEIEFVGRAPEYRPGQATAQVAAGPKPDSSAPDGW